jgi:hypothetical protein
VNGVSGFCKSYDTVKSRYTVVLYQTVFPPKPSTMALKVENVEMAGGLAKHSTKMKHDLADGVAANFGKESLANAQNIQQKFDQRLRQHGWTIEHLLIVILALHVGLWYVRGFLRTLLFMFLWYIPLIVSLQDIISPTATLTEIPKRFALNFRKHVLSTVPGSDKISDRLIVGAYLCLAMFSLKYIASNPYAGAQAAKAAAAAVGGGIGGISDKKLQALKDKYYGLGYDEGSAGRPFGSALDEEPTNDGGLSYGIGDAGEGAPKVAGLKNLMGFNGLISLGLFGKFILDIGKGAGDSWGLDNVQRNLQGQEGKMKLIMPAFGVYRLYSCYKGN